MKDSGQVPSNFSSSFERTTLILCSIVYYFGLSSIHKEILVLLALSFANRS